MKSFHVLDIEFDSVCQNKYNLAIFASGYESRCNNIPSLLDPCMIDRPIVYGFKEDKESGSRAKNDKAFLDRWGQKPNVLSSENEKPIYDYLSKNTQATKGPIRILVDYSSMSRLWYTAVLNWSRFSCNHQDIIIDFVYSMGKYQKEKNPMVIREMVSIPGCEGRAFRLRESVAIFGLGFHGLAALCVLDKLEADSVYTFLASPGSSNSYITKTRKINKDLINDNKTKASLELPLSSIESCYRHLADMIAPHRPDGEITLVPMGPKPHVLTSILVAMRFKEVSCLRVSGTPDLLDVKPTGEIVATRVVLSSDNK